ncbi:MAG TPA: pitrilysin family protein [Vitreimonas sp.]|nr:pitrilysin family protein [Vitreimonas sp.]
MLVHTIDNLPSGLTVLRIPMPSVKSVTVLSLVNTGSRYEEPKEHGIAHFFEHMVFKGTAKYEDAQALSAAVDAVGADFNAFTSKEYTGYYVKSASKDVELALDVISDMLLTPRLRQDDIDREKNVIIEEMNMYMDSPSRHISDVFDQMMFEGSGLGHDVIGNKTTVSALTASDFTKFLQQWYGLGNTILVLAGDSSIVDTDSILAKISDCFSKKTEERAGKVKLNNYFTQNPISVFKLKVEHKQTEQAHFIFGFPGIDRHNSDRYALTLLSALLGGNMSSRLFSEIREKRGLCYYVHSDVDMYHNSGMFGASAGVDPKRVEEAFKVTIDEFAALVDGRKPVTESEIQKAKDYVAGKMVLGLEDSESVAQYFGMKQLLLGEIEPPEVVLAKLRQVTRDEVEAVAKNLIKPSEIRFAVIGPYKDETPFKKILESYS